MWSYHNIRPKGATSHTSIISMWDHNITLSSKTSIICRMKLVQEGKSWKARNLLSSPHSKSLTSKSKLSSLCSNSWARLRCYPHFPSSMHIKPRSGCHRLSSNLDWSWNWLAVGSGLPRNAFLWPIVSNLCSLLSLTVLNKGVSFFLTSVIHIWWTNPIPIGLFERGDHLAWNSKSPFCPSSWLSLEVSPITNENWTIAILY